MNLIPSIHSLQGTNISEAIKRYFHIMKIFSLKGRYLKYWQRKFLESKESFKKNEFDSKHPFTARN